MYIFQRCWLKPPVRQRCNQPPPTLAIQKVQLFLMQKKPPKFKRSKDTGFIHLIFKLYTFGFICQHIRPSLKNMYFAPNPHKKKKKKTSISLHLTLSLSPRHPKHPPEVRYDWTSPNSAAKKTTKISSPQEVFTWMSRELHQHPSKSKSTWMCRDGS